jgi:hypothetical protein
MPYPGPVLVAIFVVIDLYCIFPRKFSVHSQCAGVDWSTRAGFASHTVYTRELLISYFFQSEHSPNEIGERYWYLLGSGVKRSLERPFVRCPSHDPSI